MTRNTKDKPGFIAGGGGFAGPAPIERLTESTDIFFPDTARQNAPSPA